jgi:hypothetical protein
MIHPPRQQTVLDRSIEAKVQTKVAEWRGPLTASVADGRQLLREVLAAPLKFTREGRTYRFSAPVVTGQLIAGAVLPTNGASPNARQLEPRHALAASRRRAQACGLSRFTGPSRCYRQLRGDADNPSCRGARDWSASKNTEWRPLVAICSPGLRSSRLRLTTVPATKPFMVSRSPAMYWIVRSGPQVLLE